MHQLQHLLAAVRQRADEILGQRDGIPKRALGIPDVGKDGLGADQPIGVDKQRRRLAERACRAPCRTPACESRREEQRLLRVGALQEPEVDGFTARARAADRRDWRCAAARYPGRSDLSASSPTRMSGTDTLSGRGVTSPRRARVRHQAPRSILRQDDVAAGRCDEHGRQCRSRRRMR